MAITFVLISCQWHPQQAPSQPFTLKTNYFPEKTMRTLSYCRRNHIYLSPKGGDLPFTKRKHNMSQQFKVYDAFSGMNLMEKNKVIRFLTEHEDDNFREDIEEAVEYAVKLKPSFGGFVLTVLRNEQIIGAVVANRTGMGSYNPNHIFVFVTLHRSYRSDKKLAKCLLEKAIMHAKGDIAMHVKPDNPALKLYQEIGFESQYLELRLKKNTNSAVV